MYSQSRELPKVPSASIEDAVGDGSVGRVMAENYENLKSDPQNAGEKPVMVECDCNLNTGETETRRSWGLTAHIAHLNWGALSFSRLPVSKNQLESD